MDTAWLASSVSEDGFMDLLPMVPMKHQNILQVKKY